MEREGNIALVDDDGGTINGSIVATTRPAPPVYDIGGLATRVDDFMVRDPSSRIRSGERYWKRFAFEQVSTNQCS